MDIQERIHQNLMNGYAPKETIGLTDQLLESLYSVALQHYKAGHHKRALSTIRSLVSLDPENPKYTLALAMILHLDKHYHQAIVAYLTSSLLDPKNPVPHFHISDCYQKIHKDNLAEDSLERAITLSAGRPEFKKLASRAKHLIKKRDSHD